MSNTLFHDLISYFHDGADKRYRPPLKYLPCFSCLSASAGERVQYGGGWCGARIHMGEKEEHTRHPSSALEEASPFPIETTSMASHPAWEKGTASVPCAAPTSSSAIPKPAADMAPLWNAMHTSGGAAAAPMPASRTTLLLSRKLTKEDPSWNARQKTAAHLRKTFECSFCDEETKMFLQYAADTKGKTWKWVASRLLYPSFSFTFLHGILNIGSMFVVSSAQLRMLLRPEDGKKNQNEGGPQTHSPTDGFIHKVHLGAPEMEPRWTTTSSSPGGVSRTPHEEEDHSSGNERDTMKECHLSDAMPSETVRNTEDMGSIPTSGGKEKHTASTGLTHQTDTMEDGTCRAPPPLPSLASLGSSTSPSSGILARYLLKKTASQRAREAVCGDGGKEGPIESVKESHSKSEETSLSSPSSFSSSSFVSPATTTTPHDSPPRQFTSILDIGAGDGNVTAQLLPFCGHQPSRIHVTEVCASMRYRLAQRGFNVLPAADPFLRYPVAPSSSTPPSRRFFDLITCFNVLDRTDRPHTLLREMHRSLAPGGVVLLAVVLPWCPFVEVGSRQKRPVESLPMRGGECCLGATFEASLVALVHQVLQPMEYEVVRWTRVPYICEGNFKVQYSVLSDAVLVLKKKSKEDGGLE